MSPERVAAGCGQTDEGYSYPADVWGLGLSVLALALGRTPWEGKLRTVFDVLALHDPQNLGIPSLRNSAGAGEKGAKASPQRSADLCDFVDSCLRLDPKLRLSAHALLLHPFVTKHRERAPARVAAAAAKPPGEPSGEQTVPGAANRGGGVGPGCTGGAREPLFSFSTSDASATRLLTSLLRHRNPHALTGGSTAFAAPDASSAPSGALAAGATAAGPAPAPGAAAKASAVGASSGAAAKAALRGLTRRMLARLRAQLPGMPAGRFQALHDAALEKMASDDARVRATQRALADAARPAARPLSGGGGGVGNGIAVGPYPPKRGGGEGRQKSRGISSRDRHYR